MWRQTFGISKSVSLFLRHLTARQVHSSIPLCVRNKRRQSAHRISNRLGDSSQVTDDDGDIRNVDAEMYQRMAEFTNLFEMNTKDFHKELRSNPRLLESWGEDHETDNNDSPREVLGWREADNEEELEEEEELAQLIPRHKLIKLLESSNKSETQNGVKKRIARSKQQVPLIKVQSEGQRERVSHRQERVGFEVQNFIQERLLSDADATDYAIYPLVTENSASPDLRRVVLHWTPARKNQANQQIAKRKIDALERRLLQKTGLFRSLLARHLNLKYAPVLEFRRCQQESFDKYEHSCPKKEMDRSGRRGKAGDIEGKIRMR
ncbi:unnamed protein product [Albugo candida]|uniref:Uncharacterized protein n=1 Tax=Albugo candida TaxID=65357 RepID=A0A024FZ94_9STRA|nr:unnamed protein product [Albugo candida]|eukprot:CCI39747.1 unnamed protein product [Albugo candida]